MISERDQALYAAAVRSYSGKSRLPSMAYFTAMFVFVVAPLLLAGSCPWTAVALSFFTFGLFQYYALIATHEAIHYGLDPSPRLNDLLGAVMGLFVTFDFAGLKTGHLAHHRWLGQEETDPDYSFYIIRNNSERISAASLILRPFRGLARMFLAGSGEGASESHNARARPVRIAAFQLALLGAFALRSPWFALSWCAALFLVPGALMHIRLIAEHTGIITTEKSIQDAKQGARTHAPPASLGKSLAYQLIRCIVAPFSFNFHHEHHAMPGIPYYNLHLANAFLMSEGYYEDKKEMISFSFIATFRQNLKLW